jgi:putative ABC transport system permease protein
MSRWWDDLRSDIRSARRTLWKTPGFALVAILTLGLGIGANTAIFSVVYGVLLDPLPFRDADSLYDISTLYPDGTAYTLSAPDFMSVRQDARTLEQVEVFSVGMFTLLGAGEPQQVRRAAVSDGLQPLLGLPVQAGRGLLPEDHQPGHTGVVVLDHRFWLREFGGSDTVIGRTLVIGGTPYVVVGVLVPDARLSREADVFIPLARNETYDANTQAGRRNEFLRVIARARPGFTPEQIDADLKQIGTRLQTSFPRTNQGLTFRAKPLADVILGDVRTPLFVLLGAVGVVLLVACANVASLLLARASTRQTEFAVRAALGAGRRRLLQQLLTEAIVLGLVGGVVGLLLAYWGTGALTAANAARLPRIEKVGINGPVVLFTLGVSLLTGIIFGAVPGLHASGKQLLQALHEGGRSGGQSGGQRLRAALVIGEIALAVVLLTGAGLLIRSFVQMMAVDLGFQPEHAAAFRIAMQSEAYGNNDQVQARVDSIVEKLRGLPGVTAVAAGTTLPLTSGGDILTFSVVGNAPPPPNVNPEIRIAGITPDYLRAIGTSMQRGRAFTDQDRDGTPPVAIINQAGVRRWFGSQDPLGRRIRVGGVEREIVGVVSDVLQYDPGRPAPPQLYLPLAQDPSRRAYFVVRTTSDPSTLLPVVRAQVHAIDPQIPVAEFAPLEELVTRSVARPRFYMTLLGLFACVALVLAATGIFGVMSYMVTRRVREIGIRVALGARPGQVVRLIVGRAMLLAAAGLVLGIIAAVLLGRVLRGQLFGVSPIDPVTFTGVILVLAASAALASYLPARRAASVDPVIVLRQS